MFTVHNFLLTICNNGYVRMSMIALYFGLCVLYYKKAELWSVTDSVLFVIVTASTVGYGNPHPTTESSRVFTIFLMMFGVFVIFSSMSGILNAGITKLNKFLANRVTSQLKRTELLFQRRLVFSIVWIVLCVFVGAGIFQALEGWSYITALYFVMQTIMTIGYGDLIFHYQSTKIFLIFYIVLSTTLLGLAINNVYTLLQNRKFLSQRKQLLKLQRKLHFLADMNEGRGVNKFEFVLTILEHIGTLDHDKDIAPWLKKFKELDTYDTGILDQQQLAQFSQQHASECEQEMQEMEQIVLSVSNVEALPQASRTVLNDLRIRSMTMGLFSNEDLYQAENYYHEEDSLLMDELDDSDDEITDNDELSELGGGGNTPRTRTGGGGGGAHSPRSPRSPVMGRMRSSTARKYSTATNISGDEEEGTPSNAGPATPGNRWYRPLSSRGGPPVSKARSKESSAEKGPSQRGIALSPLSEATSSPLHGPQEQPDEQQEDASNDAAVAELTRDSSGSVESPPAEWTPRSSGGDGSPHRSTGNVLFATDDDAAVEGAGGEDSIGGEGPRIPTSRPISGEFGSTYNALRTAAQDQQHPQDDQRRHVQVTTGPRQTDPPVGSQSPPRQPPRSAEHGEAKNEFIGDNAP